MRENDPYMDEALALAARGGAWVNPNPQVGALVVKGGRVVGQGWHQKYGGPHAEIFALEAAGAEARGAALYCTLEPCNHFGKTPPCTRAIIEAGIRTVVLGARDPHPQAGGGVEALRQAGVEVVTGVREHECRLANAPFFKRVRTGLPFIRLKWAMSADGRIATVGGESKWITGEEARAHAHRLRARHDAVLIGIGTLLADGARLNCRADDGQSVRQPARVILDSNLRTPLDAPLWSVPGAGQVVIACKASAPVERARALEARGAAIIMEERLPSPVALPEILKELASRGMQAVLVEGGSRVHGSFLDAKLCDAASIYLGAKLLGGSAAPGPVGGAGIERIGNALPFGVENVEQLGGDVYIAGRCGEWKWLDA